jgi:nicotinate-nucleotide pyrophosphorylase (carboxylating)
MISQNQLHQFISSALSEDIGTGDHSTLCCIEEAVMGKALLHIKQDGIIAGIEIAKAIFEYVEPTVVFNPFKTDGEWVKKGDLAFEITASIRTILQCERLVLNTMQRMSGIASLTHKYAQKIEKYNTELLDTRKTIPNFRILEKEAVRIGGGQNHRFGLYDMIMLKDNHIDYCGSIELAIEKANQYLIENKLSLKIEVETRTLEDVQKVVALGKVDRIMLDNFTPDQISAALKIIDRKFETEASGGITIDNIESYAATGVDYISCGSLIHQAQSIDLSLKAVVVE